MVEFASGLAWRGKALGLSLYIDQKRVFEVCLIVAVFKTFIASHNHISIGFKS